MCDVPLINYYCCMNSQFFNFLFDKKVNFGMSKSDWSDFCAIIVLNKTLHKTRSFGKLKNFFTSLVSSAKFINIMDSFKIRWLFFTRDHTKHHNLAVNVHCFQSRQWHSTSYYKNYLFLYQRVYMRTINHWGAQADRTYLIMFLIFHNHFIRNLISLKYCHPAYM